MNWTKKETAAHFGVSLTTVDNWIRTGCPAEYNEAGRLSGMLFGEVCEWLREQSHPDLRKRGRAAIAAEFSLIGMRLAFLRPAPYLALLKDAGLSDADARDFYRRLLRQAGGEIAATFRVPADELVRLADRDIPTEEPNHE